MNAIDVLNEWKQTLKSKDLHMYNTIRKHNPFQYEEEFGVDFVNFTDEMLADMFVYKMGMYKFSAMKTIFDKYKKFYQYCVEQGYIRLNPFIKSANLNHMRLIAMAVENGNVPLYSRQYIINKCNMLDEDCRFYYKALLLSLFEGIPSLTQLVEMKYTDIDFIHSSTKIDGHVIPLSNELLDSYIELHHADYMIPYRRKEFFDNTGNYLIKKIISKRQNTADTKTNASNLSLKIKKNIGIEVIGCSDSGIIDFLISELGKEKLIHMFFNDYDKIDKIRINDELEKILKKRNIMLEGKKAIEAYSAYVLALKYQKIVLE